MLGGAGAGGEAAGGGAVDRELAIAAARDGGAVLVVDGTRCPAQATAIGASNGHLRVGAWGRMEMPGGLGVQRNLQAVATDRLSERGRLRDRRSEPGRGQNW